MLRLLGRLLPRRFRERHGLDLIECQLDAWREEAKGRGGARATAFWMRVYWATALLFARQWARAIRNREGSELEVGMGWDGWYQDTRIALRGLLRRPLFACVVILTLGVGLGANVAV